MPYIAVEGGNLTDSQKEALIARLTATASSIMRVPQEFFTVAIKELPDNNLGIGGKTIGAVKAEYARTHRSGA